MVLPVKDLELLSEGKNRRVYRHPEDPGLLIKVVKPDVRPRSAWLPKMRRRHLYSLPMLREIREQLLAGIDGADPPEFMQRIQGLVQTDLGPGLVVRAELSADGGLAPTLRMLVERGLFDASKRDLLEQFFAEVLASRVVVNDMSWANIVYSEIGPGRPRFVLIDGIGDKPLIPLQYLSSGRNRRVKEKWIARVRAWLARMNVG